MKIPELEDQQWFPQWMRRYQMEFIGFMVSKFRIYRPVEDVLRSLVSQTRTISITDCCSGAGGPVTYLSHHLVGDITIKLTDIFPQQPYGLPPHFTYLQKSVNVLSDSLPGTGMITMFNAFHHFDGNEKKALIQKLVRSNRPFVIAEILAPTLPSFATILFTTTIGQWLMAPFIKPFSFSRLFFTYVLPINLITIAWDGMASVLKSSSFGEFQQLAKDFSVSGYQIAAIKKGNLFSPIFILKGTPDKP